MFAILVTRDNKSWLLEYTHGTAMFTTAKEAKDYLSKTMGEDKSHKVTYKVVCFNGFSVV